MHLTLVNGLWLVELRVGEIHAAWHQALESYVIMEEHHLSWPPGTVVLGRGVLAMCMCVCTEPACEAKGCVSFIVTLFNLLGALWLRLGAGGCGWSFSTR